MQQGPYQCYHLGDIICWSWIQSWFPEEYWDLTRKRVKDRVRTSEEYFTGYQVQKPSDILNPSLGPSFCVHKTQWKHQWSHLQQTLDLILSNLMLFSARYVCYSNCVHCNKDRKQNKRNKVTDQHRVKEGTGQSQNSLFLFFGFCPKIHTRSVNKVMRLIQYNSVLTFKLQIEFVPFKIVPLGGYKPPETLFPLFVATLVVANRNHF